MPSSTIDQSKFDSIPDAIEAFRKGEFLVVLDDPSRENEADLIIAADALTTGQMAFMIRHSSGYDPRGTAYAVSVDAADPLVTTGISAHDRALTCRVLADPASRPDHFRRPGHVLPLRARPGGVRERPGHTEAAVDFCRLAGKPEAAAICELVDDGNPVEGAAVHDDAGMMRGEQCVDFARRFGLKVCTIADLVAYLEKTEGKLAVNGSS
ncbi:3,4-dihydroxy-2-butanone 4-phosphate synthase [Colletotrichum higginsianum]|nr:3,4-dihydroxy-2-butanone 4-phosphate synthase [Colletotrichum higginsianum]